MKNGRKFKLLSSATHSSKERKIIDITTNLQSSSSNSLLFLDYLSKDSSFFARTQAHALNLAGTHSHIKIYLNTTITHIKSPLALHTHTHRSFYSFFIFTVLFFSCLPLQWSLRGVGVRHLLSLERQRFVFRDLLARRARLLRRAKEVR
jgi:hypothetical protein